VRRETAENCSGQTADRRPQTADCRGHRDPVPLPSAICRLPSAPCRLPSAVLCRLPSGVSPSAVLGCAGM